jgi:hypothetical protein
MNELEFWRPIMLRQELEFRGWSHELKERVLAFASFYCYDAKSYRYLGDLVDFAIKERKVEVKK